MVLSRVRMRWKRRAQGRSVQRRRVRRPARLTMRPGWRRVRAEGAGEGKPVPVVGVTEEDGPADQVVGLDGAGQLGAVGGEMPRGDVGESGAFFEVSNGQFDDRVMTVFSVDGDDGLGAVGDKGVVAPVGEQGGPAPDEEISPNPVNGVGWLELDTPGLDLVKPRCRLLWFGGVPRRCVRRWGLVA